MRVAPPQQLRWLGPGRVGGQHTWTRPVFGFLPPWGPLQAAQPGGCCSANPVPATQEQRVGDATLHRGHNLSLEETTSRSR